MLFTITKIRNSTKIGEERLQNNYIKMLIFYKDNKRRQACLLVSSHSYLASRCEATGNLHRANNQSKFILKYNLSIIYILL